MELLLGLFLGILNFLIFTLSCNYMDGSLFPCKMGLNLCKLFEFIFPWFGSSFLDVSIVVVLHQSCSRMTPFPSGPPGFL
jgi:hypothetical protein